MHDSVMHWLRKNIALEDVRDKQVLEVGAMDLNGSPRYVIEPMGPLRYVGVDSGMGRGVDCVCPAEGLTEYMGRDWDLVVSTEMLEHAENWRAVVAELKNATAIGGNLIVTTRGPGFPYHAHPGDFWRFTRADFERIFDDMEILALDDDPMPGYPGVFLKALRRRDRYRINLAPIEVAPAPAP